jgi:hypothetical protein
MLYEPIEIELDRKRKFKLNLKALMRAEREINRRRGAEIGQFASIDFLIIQGAKTSLNDNGSFPLDLLMVLLWAGLTDEEPNLAIDDVPDLIEVSPLTRSKILTLIWDYYLTATTKADQAKTNGATDERPLALRPGSTSGPLQ